MKQTLKYGLTTALRSFEVPDTWSDTTTIITSDQLQHVPDALPGAQSYRVAPNTKGDLIISTEIADNEDQFLTVEIGENCDITILDTLSGTGALKRMVKLFIKQGANVQYTIVQELSEQSIALLRYDADIEHAQLKWLFVGLGGDTTQAFIGTDAGERAQVVNNAVLYGTGSQQFDIHVSTNHVGSYSRSDMLTRSVLDDNARAVYHGLIHIGQNAPECDSYQKDEVILLSDRAGADAIPNLEIQNNKVRCSHGASIGKLDAEKLFYFLSRGISKDEAKRMITEGFLFSILPQSLHEKITVKAGASSDD